MSINPEIVGRVYPSENTYVVGREKIREFARAVHAENPLHHDVEAARAAGYADVIAPPTFAIILAQAADAALINDDSAGMGAGAMLTTREEIVDAQGEPVTTCISSLLVRAEEEN